MQEQNPFDWNKAYSGDETDYAEPDPEILGLINDLQPGQALDVGCGAGGLVVALTQWGWHVTGIDQAPKAIEAAERIVQTRGFDADLQVADATKWQPAGLYDLVVCSFALPETRPGRTAVFRMMKSSLAPGGTVLLKDFDSSMHSVSFFTGLDLVTIGELTTAFDDFSIIAAKIVEAQVKAQSSDEDSRDEPWTAALFHAQRPCKPD